MKKLLMAMLGLTILTGCTSEPAKPVQTEKKQPKATEAVTGRTAFQKLYISARNWARDIHSHDDMGTSTCVAPAPIVAARSARYQG